MRAWALLLAGLTVWAVHFFALYAIASVLPGQPSAVWWIAVATALAVTANVVIVRLTSPVSGRSGEIDGWVARVARLGAAISLVAVLWQAFPALLV